MNNAIRCAGLVAAVLSGSVFAQSSVTIAGRVDLGPQWIDNGIGKQERIDSGTYTASRLIFKGSEDMGGGLGALFYLENRFNADTGTPQSATAIFNAGSFVGLTSKTWGALTIGRQYVPMFWSFLWADDTGPLRLHNYSAVQSVQRSNFARLNAAASPIKAAGSLDTISGGVYALSITSAFENNLVVYKTPSFSGATLTVAGGVPEGYAAGNGKIIAGDLEYRNGDLYASVAYNQKQGKVPAGGSANQKIQEELASGMYAVTQSFKLWGNAHPWKLESTTGELKGRDWMLGTSYWFPNSELWTNYAGKTISNCVSCNSRGFGVGYNYFLSKRTELYTSIARVGNDANSGNTLNGFAPGAFGKSVRGVAAGMATTF